MTHIQLFQTAIIRPERQAEVSAICKRIAAGKLRYEAVSASLGNGIPWWFIGITHFMEAGGKKNPFLYHLHCGDPLTGRTVNVPKGRPKANPGGGAVPPSKDNPYTWEESALDALQLMGYDKASDWSIPGCLDKFEKFNGMGYRKRGIPSPYLWSYTQHYAKGKFVIDRKFDPNAVSKQPGCAALMKGLGVQG